MVVLVVSDSGSANRKHEEAGSRRDNRQDRVARSNHQERGRSPYRNCTPRSRWRSRVTVVAPPAVGGAEGTGCGRTVKIRNETIYTEQLSPTRELLDLAARVAEDQRRASRQTSLLVRLLCRGPAGAERPPAPSFFLLAGSLDLCRRKEIKRKWLLQASSVELGATMTRTMRKE